MSYRKNVFVIGAGVSLHRDAPLMGNFLEVAREILDRASLAPEQALRFQNVIQYWINHDLTEKDAKLKLSNLEDLFGLVDLNLRVDPSLAPVRSDMIFMILKTLEEKITGERLANCYVEFQSASGNSTEVRQASIMRQFVDIVARRWYTAPSSGVAQDSIISTNYDVLIEQALTQGEMEADYALPDHHPSTK